MDEKRCQIIGLVGFIIAGFFFVWAGINFGDPLTTIGSIIWVLSCFVWMIPLVRLKQK